MYLGHKIIVEKISFQITILWISSYRWVPLKPDFLGAWKFVWLKHYPAYPIIIISLIIQRNLAAKIWAKWESGLTAVRLKWDPPVFASSVISLTSTTLIIYLFCKHKQIRMLITSLILHKIKDIEASSNETNSECKTLGYIGIIFAVLSLIIVTFLHYRKSSFCKGQKFSNAVKIMLFISDVQNYVPIKLCKTAGSIHLFKIRGMLKPEDIKLNKNYLWDMMEIDWHEVTVTFNDNRINLPRIVVVRLHDKIKVRRLMNREPLLFHVMIK